MNPRTLDDHMTATAAPDEVASPLAWEAPGQIPCHPRRRLLLGLALLLLVADAALLLLDFRALQGQYDTEQQVTTSASGVDAGHRLPPSRQLDLYVSGQPDTT